MDRLDRLCSFLDRTELISKDLYIFFFLMKKVACALIMTRLYNLTSNMFIIRVLSVLYILLYVVFSAFQRKKSVFFDM